jgi:hypothetical protein
VDEVVSAAPAESGYSDPRQVHDHPEEFSAAGLDLPVYDVPMVVGAALKKVRNCRSVVASKPWSHTAESLLRFSDGENLHRLDKSNKQTSPF